MSTVDKDARLVVIAEVVGVGKRVVHFIAQIIGDWLQQIPGFGHRPLAAAVDQRVVVVSNFILNGMANAT